MTYSLQEFNVSSFQEDLTGNHFDIVLFRIFHIGVLFGPKRLFIYLQKPSKAYVLGLWLSSQVAQTMFGDIGKYRHKIRIGNQKNY